MKPADQSKGFTLVEVVIALGIFTFGVMGMVTLLPQTIVSHRQAISITVLAQITQQLSAEVQMCGPAQFSTYNNQQWYFDYQGTQLSSSSPGIVYRAETKVATVQLSGTTAASSSLQLVQIYATFDPTPTGTVLSGLVTQGTPNGVIIVDQPTALAGGL